MLASGLKVLLAGIDMPFTSVDLRVGSATITISARVMPSDLRSIMRFEKFPVLILSRKIDEPGYDFTEDNSLVVFDGLAMSVQDAQQEYTNFKQITITAVAGTLGVLSSIIYQELALWQVFSTIDSVQQYAIQKQVAASSGTMTYESTEVPGTNANSTLFLERLLIKDSKKRDRLRAPNHVYEFAINNLLQPVSQGNISSEMRFFEQLDPENTLFMFSEAEIDAHNNGPEITESAKIKKNPVLFANKLFELTKSFMLDKVDANNDKAPFNPERDTAPNTSISKLYALTSQSGANAELAKTITGLFSRTPYAKDVNEGIKRLALSGTNAVLMQYFYLLDSSMLVLDDTTVKSVLAHATTSDNRLRVSDTVREYITKEITSMVTQVYKVFANAFLRSSAKDEWFDSTKLKSDSSLNSVLSVFNESISSYLEKIGGKFTQGKPQQDWYGKQWPGMAMPPVSSSVCTNITTLAYYLGDNTKKDYTIIGLLLGSFFTSMQLISNMVTSLSSNLPNQVKSLDVRYASAKVVLSGYIQNPSTSGIAGMSTFNDYVSQVINDPNYSTREDRESRDDNTIQAARPSNYKLFDFMAAKNCYAYRLDRRMATINMLRKEAVREGEEFPTLKLRNFMETINVIRNSAMPQSTSFTVLDAMNRIYSSMLYEMSFPLNKVVCKQDGISETLPKLDHSDPDTCVGEMLLKPSDIMFAPPKCNILLLEDRNKMKVISPEMNLSKLLVSYHFAEEALIGEQGSLPTSKYIYDLFNPTEVTETKDYVAPGAQALVKGFGDGGFKAMHLYGLDSIGTHDIGPEVDRIVKLSKAVEKDPLYANESEVRLELPAVDAKVFHPSLLQEYNAGRIKLVNSQGNEVTSGPLQEIVVNLSGGNLGEALYDKTFYTQKELLSLKQMEINTRSYTPDTVPVHRNLILGYNPPKESRAGAIGVSPDVYVMQLKTPDQAVQYAFDESIANATGTTSQYTGDLTGIAADNTGIADNIIRRSFVTSATTPKEAGRVNLYLHLTMFSISDYVDSAIAAITSVSSFDPASDSKNAGQASLAFLSFIKLNIIDTLLSGLVDGAFQETFLATNKSATYTVSELNKITTDLRVKICDAIVVNPIEMQGDDARFTMAIDWAKLSSDVRFNALLAPNKDALDTNIKSRLMVLKGYKKIYTRLMKSIFLFYSTSPASGVYKSGSTFSTLDKVFMKDFPVYLKTTPLYTGGGKTQTEDITTRSLVYTSDGGGRSLMITAADQDNNHISGFFEKSSGTYIFKSTPYNEGYKSFITDFSGNNRGVCDPIKTKSTNSTLAISYLFGHDYFTNAEKSETLKSSSLIEKLRVYSLSSGSFNGRIFSYNITGAPLMEGDANENWSYAPELTVMQSKLSDLQAKISSLLGEVENYATVSKYSSRQVSNAMASKINTPYTLLIGRPVEGILSDLSDALFNACLINMHYGYSLPLATETHSNFKNCCSYVLGQLPKMVALSANLDAEKVSANVNAPVVEKPETADVFMRQYANFGEMFGQLFYSGLLKETSPFAKVRDIGKNSDGTPKKCYLHDGADISITDKTQEVKLFAWVDSHVLYIWKPDGYGMACFVIPDYASKNSVPDTGACFVLGHLDVMKTVNAIVKSENKSVNTPKTDQELRKLTMSELKAYSKTFVQDSTTFAINSDNGLCYGSYRKITSGTYLGTMGDSGGSSGLHLHLSCRLLPMNNKLFAGMSAQTMGEMWSDTMSREQAVRDENPSNKSVGQIKTELIDQALSVMDDPRNYGSYPEDPVRAHIYSKYNVNIRKGLHYKNDSITNLGYDAADKELATAAARYLIENTLRYRVQQYALQQLKGVMVPPQALPYHDPYFLDGGMPFAVVYKDDIVFTTLQAVSLSGDTTQVQSQLQFGQGMSLRLMLFYILRYLNDASQITQATGPAAVYTLKEFADTFLIYPPSVVPLYNSTLMNKKEITKEYQTMFGQPDFVFDWPKYTFITFDGNPEQSLYDIAQNTTQANSLINYVSRNAMWLLNPDGTDTDKLRINLDMLRKEDSANGALSSGEQNALLRYRSWASTNLLKTSLWKNSYRTKQTNEVVPEQGYLDLYTVSSFMQDSNIEKAFAQLYSPVATAPKDSPLTYYNWSAIFSQIRKCFYGD